MRAPPLLLAARGPFGDRVTRLASSRHRVNIDANPSALERHLGPPDRDDRLIGEAAATLRIAKTPAKLRSSGPLPRRCRPSNSGELLPTGQQGLPGGALQPRSIQTAHNLPAHSVDFLVRDSSEGPPRPRNHSPTTNRNALVYGGHDNGVHGAGRYKPTRTAAGLTTEQYSIADITRTP